MYEIKLIKETETRKDFILFLNNVAVGNMTLRGNDFKDFKNKIGAEVLR